MKLGMRIIKETGRSQREQITGQENENVLQITVGKAF
jgi:hypothetical protein